MKVPDSFLKSILDDIASLLGPSKTVSLSLLERLVGRIGRVAQIVPATRPFAGAFFAALMAARSSATIFSRREAPPGKAAVKRFRTTAAWFQTLLTSKELGPLLLQREFWPHGARSVPKSGYSAEFDASPWGGGAVLRKDEVCL